MNCIMLSRGAPPEIALTLTVSGSFNSTYGYVKVGETTYTSAQTVSVAAGTEVTVYVGGRSSSARKNCYISLNGEKVLSGAAGDYTFAMTRSTSVVMSLGSSYYYATITTT